MAEKIRLVERDDIQKIVSLYKGEKTYEELNWLLRDPYDLSKYSAYVAVNNDDEVVGVIGFFISHYAFGDKKIVGAMPMSWKIADGYKGISGVNLLNKVLSQGQFSMTVQGSDIAQKLYYAFNLKVIGAARVYIKVFYPRSYFISMKERGLYSRLGNFVSAMPSYLNKYQQKQKKSLSICEIGINQMSKNVPYLNKEYFEKEVTFEYLRWMASCPILETHLFEIHNENVFMGYCLCFIKSFANGTSRGRVVYKPNFGNNKKLLRELLSYLQDFFIKRGCCSITILALDKTSSDVLEEQHFVNCRRKQKPIYIKSKNGALKNLTTDKWYMQYTEGDKAYRDI